MSKRFISSKCKNLTFAKSVQLSDVWKSHVLGVARYRQAAFITYGGV